MALEHEQTELTTEELHDTWPVLSSEDRREAFRLLPPDEALELMDELSARDQAYLLPLLSEKRQRLWLRSLAPDDVADLLQETDAAYRPRVLEMLDQTTRVEVRALLLYAEDVAGGLMNPRFIVLRPEMGVDEAIRYIRIQARSQVETIYYVYVIDSEQHLLGVVTLRELMMAARNATVDDVMERDIVAVRETMDQEHVSRLFRQYGYIAVPVVDDENRIRGIITYDDIVDVVNEEATEDIHKLGGSEALPAPYLDVGILDMVKARGGWLSLLFFGAMLTATAMRQYEAEIEAAVVLAVFIPLIISSGGNSGSQAATLVVRAMGLDEIRLSDWKYVLKRETATGLVLGSVLGLLGFLRVFAWEKWFSAYGEHYLQVGATVGLSLVGIVLWGTISGSMLPFVLRRFGFDPASSSAPFVATIVDVTGIVIYFTLAGLLLSGAIL